MAVLGQINSTTTILEDGDFTVCWASANNSTSNPDNTWLDRQNGTPTVNSPYVAVEDMTITGIAISSNAVDTWGIAIWLDGGGGFVVIHTVSAVNSKSAQDTGLSIDINQGDRFAMRVSGGGNPDYPNCDIYLKSR